MTTKALNGTTLEAGIPQIIIPSPRIEVIQIPIVGTAPLIVHAWSEKAKRMMLEAQQVTDKPKIKKVRESRNPEADFQGARYVSDEGWDGFPVVGFKAAMVNACRLVTGLNMTLARRLFFVETDGRSQAQNTELVRIYGEPRMRTDMVRLGGVSNPADLRYRPEYSPWRAVLTIRYNAGMISAEHIANLVALAGQFEGVGEWRPGQSATGSYGLWEIE